MKFCVMEIGSCQRSSFQNGMYYAHFANEVKCLMLVPLSVSLSDLVDTRHSQVFGDNNEFTLSFCSPRIHNSLASKTGNRQSKNIFFWLSFVVHVYCCFVDIEHVFFILLRHKVLNHHCIQKSEMRFFGVHPRIRLCFFWCWESGTIYKHSSLIRGLSLERGLEVRIYDVLLVLKLSNCHSRSVLTYLKSFYNTTEDYQLTLTSHYLFQFV